MGRASSAGIHSGTVTPILSPERDGPRRKPNKRKQTLLSLLDALSELTQDDELENGVAQQQSFEDDHDVPTVDEQHQVAGGDAFHKFAKRITNLDQELRNFSNAARQLGSSVAILSSAFHLRERLAQLLFLFRENAADLFPRKVPRQPQSAPNPTSKKRRRTRKPPPHVARPTADRDLEPEDFPEQIEGLGRDVVTFLNCLNEFPEFTDEAVSASIQSFEGDLKYWASCLQEYHGQFKYPAVQRYLHDLAGEMGDHLDSITNTLNYFTDVGVPTIRFAQKHGAQNLQNLSTVATFFSAVTATTLQFSFDAHTSPAENAVNAFWFASLVFSIASAVNSLLGVTWKQAMYRSPGHRVPWWVLIWIKRSPLVFLVMSVACFSIGLVLFAYSSHQSFVTTTITTVMTAFSSFGLAAVSLWFYSERWAFSRHKGKKWLADILDDASDLFARRTGIQFLSEKGPAALERSSMKIRRMTGSVRQLGSWTAARMAWGHRGGSEAGTEDTLPVSNASGHHPQSPVSPATPRPSEALSMFSDAKVSTEGALTPIAEKTEAPGPSSSTGVPRPRGRFATAVRNMMLMRQSMNMMPGSGSPDTPLRQRTMLGLDAFGPGSMSPPMRSNRLAALTPKLQCLETTQDLAAHSALVRHLQFSPDGKFLATCSWDRTSVMFRVGAPAAPLIAHRVLAHPQGFVHQVAWSPSGNSLLTRLTRGIKIWTEDGVCRKTIDRKRNVQSITWLPGGEAFMSVEKAEEGGSHVVKLDLTGKPLDTYRFESLELHDVAVTPDCQRMLGVGTLLMSHQGLKPSNARAEKRIISYNLDRGEIESQVPVLNDVRDITLARITSGQVQVALVSYENKAPPQLWKLDMIKQRDDESHITSRLTLRHTYMPRVPVDFAGPSYFGGKNDQLVLCAAKAGDIHIWDRESGALLHHVRTSSGTGGDLTCIAWNHAAEDPFMFATGSHDGGVRIWTKPLPRLQFDDAQSLSHSQSGAQTPRSRTPSIMDLEYRTESPLVSEFALGQLTDGLMVTTPPGQGREDDGPSLRRRSVIDEDDGPGLRPRRAVAFLDSNQGRSGS